jgi:hypothetical protein
MKHVYLATAFIAFSAIGASAQTALPNGAFESWDTVEFQLDPSGYYTPDSAEAAFSGEVVTQSMDAHTGQYSVKLSTIMNVTTQVGSMMLGHSDGMGIPFSGRPDKIRGWYKPQLGTVESATLQMGVYANGFEVGHADFPFNGTSDWTFFEQAVSYIDTAAATSLMFNVFMQGGAPGDLYLDDLEFVYGSAAVSEASITNIVLAPNPCDGVTVLEVSHPRSGQRFVVTDVLGRVVLTETLNSSSARISLDSPGVFSVKLVDASGNALQQKMLIVR